MERFVRYCLSALVVATMFACGEEYSNLNSEERRRLSEQVFSAGAHLPQGSPKSMTRIAEAIEIDSTYAEALREHSVAYLKRGMPHKWKPWFDKAVYHDPQTWQPWRGYLYLWFYRDYEKAIADFNASDTLTPYMDYPQGHSVDYWRGIAYLGLKDYNNSIAYFDKHILRETEDTGEDWVEINAFLYRGIAYMNTGKDDKALENFDKVIHYFKKSADAKYWKAKIMKRMGEKEKALALVHQAEQDFKEGYFNNRPYVETLYQLYPENFVGLKQAIKD